MNQYVVNIRKNKKEIQRLQKVYAVRQALAETLREKANKIDTEILNTYHFADEEGYRVVSPDEIYTIKNDKLFYKLRKIAFRKAGLGHPQDEDGVSVECVAEMKLVEYKHKIFEYALSIIPASTADTLRKGKFQRVEHHGKQIWIFDQVIDNFLKLQVA